MSLPKEDFWEGTLPQGCPPGDAVPAPDDILLRLIPAETPTKDHFRSSKADGKKRPKKCDVCTFCACSVWKKETPREKLSDLAKLPKLQELKYIASIKVNAASGKVRPHPDNSNHLSFWMYAKYQPENSVVKVEAL